MLRTESEHCKIVAESLRRGLPVDEQTCASIAILNDRLEAVKAIGEAFAEIDFSPDVKKLAQKKCRIAVC